MNLYLIRDNTLFYFVVKTCFALCIIMLLIFTNSIWLQLAAKFRNSGQTCVCANRILVQEGILIFMWFGCYWGLVSSITKLYVASIGIYEKFASAFIKAVRSLHVGNGLEESTSQVQCSNNCYFHHDKWSSSISILFFLCLLLKQCFAFKVYELFKPNITVLTKLPFTFFCCHTLIFLMCSVLYFVYLILYFF
jgi:hypothetical protein